MPTRHVMLYILADSTSIAGTYHTVGKFLEEHHASLAQSNLLPDSIFGNLKNA